MKRIAISLITFYQNYLSFDKGVLAVFAPGGACKYEVSCSQYTKQMIENYGIAQGLTLGLKRIWSCK